MKKINFFPESIDNLKITDIDGKTMEILESISAAIREKIDNGQSQFFKQNELLFLYGFVKGLPECQSLLLFENIVKPDLLAIFSKKDKNRLL